MFGYVSCVTEHGRKEREEGIGKIQEIFRNKKIEEGLGREGLGI